MYNTTNKHQATGDLYADPRDAYADICDVYTYTRNDDVGNNGNPDIALKRQKAR